MDRRLYHLPLHFLIPFAVLIHPICSAEALKLLIIGTATAQSSPLRRIHGYIIQIAEFQLGNSLVAFRTELLVPVQHMNPMTMLTVVHVHHEKFPFSHNNCNLSVCQLHLYCVSYSGQSQEYIIEKCNKRSSNIAQIMRKHRVKV